MYKALVFNHNLIMNPLLYLIKILTGKSYWLDGGCIGNYYIHHLPLLRAISFRDQKQEIIILKKKKEDLK